MIPQKTAAIAAAVFAAYSHNSGNPPDTHFDRSAAEQWMAQALIESGVIAALTARDEFEVAATEYVLARNDYEDATRRPNSHAPARVIGHGDPRALRYREARAAFDAKAI